MTLPPPPLLRSASRLRSGWFSSRFASRASFRVRLLRRIGFLGRTSAANDSFWSAALDLTAVSTTLPSSSSAVLW